MNANERREWLKKRRNHIGGSDVPAILGLSSFKNIHDIYLSKIDESEPEDEVLSDPQFFGHEMEAPIINRFLRDHKEVAVYSRQDFAVSKKNPIFSYTPDCIFQEFENGKQILGECKNFHWMMASSLSKDEIPDTIMAQVQHGMNVLNLDQCWLMVLTGGQNYFEFLIDRDQELIDLMEPELLKFWECVQSRTIPAVDGSESCSKVIQKLNYGKKELSINLPAGVEDLIKKIQKNKIEIALLEEEKELNQNQIKILMGQATKAMTPSGYKIGWNQVEAKKVFDVDAFKLKYADLYKQFETKEKAGYRQFRITEPKG